VSTRPGCDSSARRVTGRVCPANGRERSRP
jgi:hypothetical protein